MKAEGILQSKKSQVMADYYPVIGLEVHVEQSTQTKMFCSCPTDHFGKLPNTQVCPICLGLPGGMPYANKKAIEGTIKFGLALHCQINKHFKFDRKHYFYPDLPKGYQISQYDFPIAINGTWKDQSGKTVRIKRIHLEEDTAKLVHDTWDGKKVSLVDFNRSGVPLMELVTEPDFADIDTVVSFLKELQEIVRSLGISTADMEKGSMRLEANISLRQHPTDPLPDYKVELKNINSFRYLAAAILYEWQRQAELLAAGKKLTQSTRGYDETKKVTFHQRSKEAENDYRYFPEPDLPIFKLTQGEIDDLAQNLPSSPSEIIRQLIDQGVRADTAAVLVYDRPALEFFQTALALDSKNQVGIQTWANLIVNKKIDIQEITPARALRSLLELQLREFASLDETRAACEKIIAANSKAVADYHAGKGQLLGFFIGAVQKELAGNGKVEVIKTNLQKLLHKNG